SNSAVLSRRRIHTSHQGMIWQERGQVGAHADRTYPRPTATMGYAEGLVQVDVGHIRADAAGLTEPHQGIEVGPVHVHLPPAFMDDGTDLHKCLLEYPVGRGIGDH